MKKTVILILVLFAQISLAQNPDIKRTWHWYFGNGAGIDFSSGTAVADTTGNLHTYEGCGAISDTAGNLLFYTDGDTVWNKLHQPMPNGWGLNGCGNYGGSSTQGGIIVPFPNDPDSMFYIFTTDCSENSFIDGLDYSVVDLHLNGGLGDVFAKNILLLQNGTEGLTITRKANSCGYFLLAHEHSTSNFIIYSIDTNGVQLHTTQSIGPVYTSWTTYFKFSNNGHFLSCSSSQGPDAVVRFNDTLGILNNYVILFCPILGNVHSSYATEFSPSNKKLYVDVYGQNIFQYSLDIYDSILICNSCSVIFDYIVLSGQQVVAHPALAPNGKIYFCSFMYNDSLSVIEYPDSSGASCNFNLFSFKLMRENWASFPNFPSSYLSPVNSSPSCISTGIIQTTNEAIPSIEVYPNPANDLLEIKNHSKINNIKLFIYNSLGQTVNKINLDNLNIYQINISKLSDGIYYLKFLNDNISIQNNKIIINN